MTQRAFACGLMTLLAGACGSSGAHSSRDTKAAVVEIPNVSETEANAAESEPPPPATPRVLTEPDPAVEEGPGELDELMWGGSGASGGSSGGPDCDRAADCCLKFAHNSAPPPSLISVCDGVRRAPSYACPHYLTSFHQVATQMGITCP